MLTVHFFQARLSRDRGGRMLVKRTPVAAQLKLLADANFLVTEDWPGDKLRSSFVAGMELTYNAPFGDEESTVQVRFSDIDTRAIRSRSYSSSFCWSVSCLRSMPEISVPRVGVRCWILLAAESKAFFSGSAKRPRSVTSWGPRGSHFTSGKRG